MAQKKGIALFLVMAFLGAAALFLIEGKETEDTESGWELARQEDSREDMEQDAVEAAEASDEGSLTEKELPEDSVSGKEICVYVCGRVKQAGVYCLPEGARLAEVIHTAGGFSKKAAKEYLNLAQKAEDGEKIYVPSRKEARKMKNSQEPAAKSEKDNNSSGGKVNLNTAEKEELMTLTGIGEAKADAILTYRKEHGGFASLEELMQVPGIKEGVYRNICDFITI